MDPNRSQTTPETPEAEANRETEGTGRISVQVDELFAAEIDATGLAGAAEAALLAEGDGDSEVSLVVTSDEVLAELNRHYRGVEGPTDVLSFAARESAPGFVSAPEADNYLGDVLIALPFVRRQAAELGRDLDDELRLLVVHGTLHLLGYDHAEPDEEAEMWARQDEILAGLK
jgi:probable rRNA maturation factor